MALTVALVIGAGLLIRTFLKLQSVDPGFEMDNVISMSMSVSGSRFQKTAPVTQLVREGTERLLAIPGVVDVGVSNCLPMAGGFGMSFDVVGRPKGNQAEPDFIRRLGGISARLRFLWCVAACLQRRTMRPPLKWSSRKPRLRQDHHGCFLPPARDVSPGHQDEAQRKPRSR